MAKDLGLVAKIGLVGSRNAGRNTAFSRTRRRTIKRTRWDTRCSY